MEGIQTKEVVYELLTDVGLRSSAVDLDTWIPDFCRAISAYPTRTAQAWPLLLKSAASNGVWKTKRTFQLSPASSRNRNTSTPAPSLRMPSKRFCPAPLT